MGGARKPQQRLNRPQGCDQCSHTPNPDHRVMNIIKQGGGYLVTLYAHLGFRLTVFTEMGGARRPQQRLSRPQGYGQSCHTPNPNHRVMNIIKKGGCDYLVTLYAHLGFRLTVFTEMGGARRPQQRLSRPQGYGQSCHTPNPNHRVMNIIKKGGCDYRHCTYTYLVRLTIIRDGRS